MNQSVQRFSNEIFAHVQGWMGPRQSLIISMLDEIQQADGVTGDIAEIGVHHGQFLFLLSAVRRDGETVHAFDVFEDQSANVDSSGLGSRQVLEEGIARWYNPSHFAVHQADSLDMRGKCDRYFSRPVRLFSVDGGHTRIHAANDLMIANDAIAVGGVVALDDFFAAVWPGVTEGFYDFMRVPGVKLAPFLNFENKLYLTTKAEQPAMLAALRAKLDAALGDEMHNGLWKYVEITGHQTLVLGRP